jgi:hypothetical protein
MKFLNNSIKKILNLAGFKTNRKLVLFVVDDYGSIRVSSKESISRLENLGVNFDKCRFSKYETIESNQDLEDLFNVLTSFKDINNNHVVFTPMACIANPDFNKIKEYNFETYYYESIIESLKNYGNHDRVIDLWRKGIELNIFVPQSHNREHLNVKRWISDLKNGNPITLAAFNEKMFSVGGDYSPKIHWEYQPALEIDQLSDVDMQVEIINAGLTLFKKICGYNAIYFTPPNATINHRLHKSLYENGIKFIDSPRFEKESIGNSKYKLHFHYSGQNQKDGMKYIVRNAVFEPNDNPNFDSVGRCLNDIEIAFQSKQPAIISSHRVNFSGYLHPDNREQGLSELAKLIKGIQLKWSDVEFISVPTLFEIMNFK